MRRISSRTALYLTGLLTLPGLIWGISILSQSTLAQFEPVPNRSQRFPTPSDAADGFEEPVPQRLDPDPVQPCLPAIRADMLASNVSDGADAEKLNQLRERMKKVHEEKALLLNATAMEAEIALLERQITELKALQELQPLQKSLEELSDKYPDSDVAKRAREVVNLLKNRAVNHPHVYQPSPNGYPVPVYSPCDPSNPQSRYQPNYPQPIYDDEYQNVAPPFRPRQQDVPEPTPTGSKAVPNPTDDEESFQSSPES